MSIKLYEVDHEYIDYLAPFAPHLFHNKKQEQQNERKYIGVILVVDDMKYFADDAECVIDYQIWFIWSEPVLLHFGKQLNYSGHSEFHGDGLIPQGLWQTG